MLHNIMIFAVIWLLVGGVIASRLIVMRSIKTYSGLITRYIVIASLWPFVLVIYIKSR
jgi:hypothetical protein